MRGAVHERVVNGAIDDYAAQRRCAIGNRFCKQNHIGHNIKGLRGVVIYRTLLILPWAIPDYITALTWKGMFHPQFGAINQAIQAFGGAGSGNDVAAALRMGASHVDAIEIDPAIAQAERWMAQHKVPVVIEIILERVTNIAMGTEIDNIVEFEEVLDLPLDDTPTKSGAPQSGKLLPA